MKNQLIKIQVLMAATLFTTCFASAEEQTSGPICLGSDEECEKIYFQIHRQLQKVEEELDSRRIGPVPILDPEPARRNDAIKRFCQPSSDEICLMTHNAAREFCVIQGKHLPSVKDWAVYVTYNLKARGLNGGFLSTRDLEKRRDDRKDISGYVRLTYVSHYQSHTEFYFDHRGFVPNMKTVARYFLTERPKESASYLWSLSSNYRFDSQTGELKVPEFSSAFAAVRCAAGYIR